MKQVSTLEYQMIAQQKYIHNKILWYAACWYVNINEWNLNHEQNQDETTH